MKPSSILVRLAVTLSATPVLAKTATTTASGTATTGLSNLPSEAPHIGQITNQGCFNSSGDLELADENLNFNSDGKCGELCQSKEKAVGATTGGQECWCGDEYPPTANLVDDTECNFPCTGFDDRACGGLDTWSVYNTGLKLAVHNSEAEGSSTTSTGNDPTQTTSTSDTQTSTATSDSGEESSNSKTVGIAVGAVAAVLIVGGGIAGVFWYLRRKRNQEIKEEHRRNAAVNAFINGSNPPGSSHGSISMTDSRLDPIMAHRRLSDGSIADNQDYSRKILRVTNA